MKSQRGRKELSIDNWNKTPQNFKEEELKNGKGGFLVEETFKQQSLPAAVWLLLKPYREIHVQREEPKTKTEAEREDLDNSQTSHFKREKAYQGEWKACAQRALP